jgi:hypothetical protein
MKMRTINLLNRLRDRTSAQSVRSRLSESPVVDDSSRNRTTGFVRFQFSDDGLSGLRLEIRSRWFRVDD